MGPRKIDRGVKIEGGKPNEKKSESERRTARSERENEEEDTQQGESPRGVVFRFPEFLSVGVFTRATVDR